MRENKPVGIAIVVIMILGIILMISILYKLIHRELCYNLPFNDFYKSDFCEVYREWANKR